VARAGYEQIGEIVIRASDAGGSSCGITPTGAAMIWSSTPRRRLRGTWQMSMPRASSDR
jgi:hypothetical protein